MADIADLTQLARANTVRDLVVRGNEVRQTGRVLDENRQQNRDAIVSLVQERQDQQAAQDVRDRRRADAIRAEQAAFQKQQRQGFEFSADASSTSDLPRGSIVDILA